MKNSHRALKKYRCILITLIGLICLFSPHSYSQTPGLIYESATGAGIAVLDPNGDGYTSLSTAGFTTDDQLQSEIPYTSFVVPLVEPNSDILSAPTCGYTDFVDQGDKDAAQRCLSGGKWKFRLRMGGTSSNSKSYSVLIDSDGLFGNSGPTADPNYTIYNPGFEIEIVLATNFGVFVYNVNTPNCTPVISYPGTTNYQKSIALTTICGTPDYFLDFFVTFSDLTSVFGITTATPTRFGIVSNTNSKTSTVCNPSSASDVDGAGSFVNVGTAFTSIVDAQGPCAPDGTGCLLRSTCPVITSSLTAGVTVISGTSAEATGTLINLYKNGVLIGTASVTAGTWSISGLTSLISGDIINATATASGEFVSSASCSSSTVSGPICTAAITSASVCASSKSVQGVATVGSTIRVYSAAGVLIPCASGTVWNAGSSTITASTIPSILTPSSDNFLWKCGGSGASAACTISGPTCLTSGNYYLTAQSAGQCESTPLWICNDLSSTTATPTISTTITTATTSVSGTIPAPDNLVPVTVYLYKNNILMGSISTSNGIWTITGLVFSACDVVKVKAIKTGASAKCSSLFSISQTISPGITSPPIIADPLCTLTSINTVTGFSSETNGTNIQLYDNGIAVGAVTTVLNGVWSVTGINILPGHTITAKATKTANCSSQSVASNAVLVSTQSLATTLLVTTNPIIEQSSTISGTYSTNGSSVQLYLDGSAIGLPAIVTGGIWSVTGLASYVLTTGGIVTAKVTQVGKCPSLAISGGTVVCIPPVASLTVLPPSAVLVVGTTISNIQVSSSSPTTIYQLYLADGITATGSSVKGNGGTITLTSGVLLGPTTLNVKAFEVPSSFCPVFLNSKISVYTVLPIELGSFSVKKSGINNQIEWMTLTELNNDYFTIEKKTDTANYDLIGIQNGAGNSSECKSYLLMDCDVQNQINYYRLKETDFDGNFRYYEPVSIDNRLNEKSIIAVKNVLGSDIDSQYRGIVFVYYSDGTVLKTMQ